MAGHGGWPATGAQTRHSYARYRLAGEPKCAETDANLGHLYFADHLWLSSNEVLLLLSEVWLSSNEVEV